MANSVALNNEVTGSLPAGLQSELEAVLRRDSAARTIAIYWPNVSELAGEIYIKKVSEHEVKVVSCASELAIREQLIQRESHTDCLVLLIDIDSSELAQDIISQLWRRQVRQINVWQTLVERLDLRAIDPRLTGNHQRWLAEELLSVGPTIEGHIRPGHVLDYDTAWLTLMRGRLNFDAAELDIDTLLSWSVSAGAIESPSADMIAGMKGWFVTKLGAVAEVVNHIIFTGEPQLNTRQLLPLGLVIELLFSHSSENGVSDAKVRLDERYLQAGKLSADVLLEFGKAAGRFAGRIALQTDSAIRRSPIEATLQQTGIILDQLGCIDVSIHSNLLPSAYKLKLERFATGIVACCSERSNGILAETEDWAKQIQEHLYPDNATRKSAVKCAIALLRWLDKNNTAPFKAAGAAALMRHYRDELGFVDFARSVLWQGDSNELLADAYHQLFKRISEQMEQHNKQFADGLPELARGDKLPPDLHYIENALEQLIAPLAVQHPVLLLVMDGMSQAVWRELGDNWLHAHWDEYQQVDANGQPTACSLVAALPSVTRVCRHALLTGKLESGVSSDEQKGFAQHPALREVTSRSAPPALFHKGQLTEGGRPGLAPEVRSVLAADKHRVVGVVVNVIDDQLASNDQLGDRWGAQALPLVQHLLDCAREAGRVLVVTSDHGHVRAYDSERGDSEDALDGRFKDGNSEVAEGETKLQGARVISADETIVVPWTEHIRYANPKKGYHGGASLQEMTVPFAVYANPAQNVELQGWQIVAQQTPPWWRANTSTMMQEDGEPFLDAAPTKMPAQGKNFDLFEPVETVAEPVATEDWIAQFLQSPVLAEQRRKAARVPLDDTTLTALLRCVEARGDQASTVEIAEATGKSSLRINGLISAARKIINVDGFDILSEDKRSKTVHLNRQQLKKQFNIDD